MIAFLDKRVLNIVIIAFLTCSSFLWTFWIFHLSVDYSIIVVVTLVRIFASILFFKDYSLSWSKATQKTFLIKSSVYIIAFCVYAPLYYGEIYLYFMISELFVYLFAINFMMYGYYSLVNRSRFEKNKHMVIYGAGKAGLKLAEEYRQSEYSLKYFVDDNKELQTRSVDGVGIVSKEVLLKKLQGNTCDLLVIAMPSADPNSIKSIYSEFNTYFAEVKILPPKEEIADVNFLSSRLKEMTVEDLLARNPKDLDRRAISDFITNKTIMISGAGGSIGSEIVRQCLKYNVKKLILIDHSEYNLYQILEELHSDVVIPIMQSVLNASMLEGVFETYKPDIFIHAAAYKHVPLVEANVHEGILNNVLGTKNCIDLAIKYKVEKFILISTDKAVRPTNVMGATKRVCELYAQNVDAQKTHIVAVRFGNVLGSSGSVIPKFKEQIAQGGPLTVTHPEMTRYFMLISEACELVLQTGAVGINGELFILNMGEPVKIVDLAQKMIALSGKKEIAITFTGLRSGEKLYEELLNNECDKKTVYDSIMVAHKTHYCIEKLQRDIDELLVAQNPIEALKKIVPEFNHNRKG